MDAELASSEVEGEGIDIKDSFGELLSNTVDVHKGKTSHV